MNKKFEIDKVISILKKESKNWKTPVITLIAIQEKDPFKVLISTIISLRTKDEVTIESSKRLFDKLKRPENIKNLDESDISELIYPAGFYRRKGIVIKNVCEKLIENHNSKVPKKIDELLELDGVGRKTANLVLAEGYNTAAICVDTHVHRISNRFGFINTKTPNETEKELMKKLPKKYWIIYNTLLVSLGQHICRPISPYCSKCPVLGYCNRIGVIKSR